MITTKPQNMKNQKVFKVGQKVVAIKDHSQLRFKKGQVFTVLAVGKTPCCGIDVIDIGVKMSFKFVECVCACTHKSDNFYLARMFRPVEYPKLSAKDIIQEEVKETLDVPVPLKPKVEPEKELV